MRNIHLIWHHSCEWLGQLHIHITAPQREQHTQAQYARESSNGVKEHTPHSLHSSKHIFFTAETVVECRPETVIINTCGETDRISDNNVSYLNSKLIPSGKMLRKVTIVQPIEANYDPFGGLSLPQTALAGAVTGASNTVLRSPD